MGGTYIGMSILRKVQNGTRPDHLHRDTSPQHHREQIDRIEYSVAAVVVVVVVVEVLVLVVVVGKAKK